MIALKWLKQFILPMSLEKPCTQVSNSELKRWIRSGSVLWNGEKCEVDEEIDFPVFSLVFFPKGKKKTTYF